MDNPVKEALGVSAVAEPTLTLSEAKAMFAEMLKSQAVETHNIKLQYQYKQKSEHDIAIFELKDWEER
jgi:hypothetical protein